MSQWAAAFQAYLPPAKIAKNAKTPTMDAAARHFGDFGRGGEEAGSSLNRDIGNIGDFGTGVEKTVRDPAARLLIELWAKGATVETGPDGALTITPHASGKRIPAVLLAAVRRHRAALADWVGADSAKLLTVLQAPG